MALSQKGRATPWGRSPRPVLITHPKELQVTHSTSPHNPAAGTRNRSVHLSSSVPPSPSLSTSNPSKTHIDPATKASPQFTHCSLWSQPPSPLARWAQCSSPTPALIPTALPASAQQSILHLEATISFSICKARHITSLLKTSIFQIWGFTWVPRTGCG